MDDTTGTTPIPRRLILDGVTKLLKLEKRDPAHKLLSAILETGDTETLRIATEALKFLRS